MFICRNKIAITPSIPKLKIPLGQLNENKIYIRYFTSYSRHIVNCRKALLFMDF